MEILIIFLLILLNGVFSMSEIALVSSKKIRLEAAMKAGKKGAAVALALAESPNRFFSTVQIGITLIGLLTGIYSGEHITNQLENYLAQFEYTKQMADGLAVTIVLIIITFCSLIFGELVPKRIGLMNPEGISRFVAPTMTVLSKIAMPLVWILTNTSDVMMKIFKIRQNKGNDITEEEIKAIIHEGTRSGEIQKIEQDIVERVFMLGDRKISSLMTPRNDLTFLHISDSFEEIQALVNEDLHRVYPVFTNNKDKVSGVVKLKDLFLAFQSGHFDLASQIKAGNYLIESTSAYKALENFKASNVHYALVTDEYGLVIGMVTMDDILQALVGEVSEFNVAESLLSKREDGSYIVDGQYPISEFLSFFRIQDKSVSQINTLAGLLLREFRDIPKEGDIIRWNNFEFEVVDMDNVRIDKVIVRKISKS